MRSIQAKSVETDHERKARSIIFLLVLTFVTILQLSLILEYIPGRVTDTLDRLIALYRPDSVVVGTRGKRSVLGGLGMNIGGTSASFGIGSISKSVIYLCRLLFCLTVLPCSRYCLTHSPVPVIVVSPERKVRKAIEKRRADPKRGKHFE